MWKDAWEFRIKISTLTNLLFILQIERMIKHSINISTLHSDDIINLKREAAFLNFNLKFAYLNTDDYTIND